jgi:hypothetical protein
MKIFVYIILVTLLFSGCYSHKELKQKNPTSYVFNANIQQIKNIIFSNYDNGSIILHPDTTDFNLFYYDYDTLYNKNDILLSTFLGAIKSKIYFKFGKPLFYDVYILLHLDSISENRTKVTAITYKSEICVGGFQLGNTGHGYSRMKKVPPSTIEEYEILLAIGRQLGDTNMPKCNYPEDK